MIPLAYVVRTNTRDSRYPHVGDDGTSFDTPYETANVAISNPAVAQHMRAVLKSNFPKAFANC